MGKNLKNVSLKGEDSSRDAHATKAKQAFLDMPREVLNKLTDIYTIVSEAFAVENFLIPNSEKQKPICKANADPEPRDSNLSKDIGG